MCGITPNEIFIDYSDLKKTTLDQSNISSYRPISQLLPIAKTSERVMSTQLINYIMPIVIVDKYQSAYLSHRSTEIALTFIINDIFIYLGNKAPCYLVLLNLSSAFYTLDYNILSFGLNEISIHG